MATLIAHNRGEARVLEARFYHHGSHGILEFLCYHSNVRIEADMHTSVRWRLPDDLKSFRLLKSAFQLKKEIIKPGMAPTLLGETIPLDHWISFADETENLFVARFEFVDGTKIICDFYSWESFVQRLERSVG